MPSPSVGTTRITWALSRRSSKRRRSVDEVLWLRWLSIHRFLSILPERAGRRDIVSSFPRIEGHSNHLLAVRVYGPMEIGKSERWLIRR